MIEFVKKYLPNCEERFKADENVLEFGIVLHAESWYMRHFREALEAYQEKIIKEINRFDLELTCRFCGSRLIIPASKFEFLCDTPSETKKK
jgi:hypothetical protein